MTVLELKNMIAGVPDGDFVMIKNKETGETVDLQNDDLEFLAK